MDYRKFGETYYVRFDRDDEIISGLINICKENGISSAIFTGIGGCKTAEIQTFIAEEGRFETNLIEGTLELLNITGNIISDENGEYFHHTHASYSYIENGEHHMAAGHMKSTIVLYTAEIELRPVIGGAIHRKYDPETGTGFWNFDEK